jgi:hypothetical protein
MFLTQVGRALHFVVVCASAFVVTHNDIILNLFCYSLPPTQISV